MPFQAFTNSSEAFKDLFCPKKKQQKRALKGGWNTIEEGCGNKIEGWVPEIGGRPAPFPALVWYAWHSHMHIFRKLKIAHKSSWKWLNTAMPSPCLAQFNFSQLRLVNPCMGYTAPLCLFAHNFCFDWKDGWNFCGGMHGVSSIELLPAASYRRVTVMLVVVEHCEMYCEPPFHSPNIIYGQLPTSDVQHCCLITKHSVCLVLSVTRLSVGHLICIYYYNNKMFRIVWEVIPLATVLYKHRYHHL